jgi:hypothetical protein
MDLVKSIGKEGFSGREVELIEGFKARGEITFVLRDKDGRVKETRVIKNVVCDVGRALVAGLINSVTSNLFKWLAIGIGTTPADPTDTALGSEITTLGGERALATTLTRVTTTVLNDTAEWIVVFTFTGGFAVTEAGIFDQLSLGGNILAHQIFGAINVVSGDSLQTTWKVQIV